MKISYNWLKSYIPKLPQPESLSDIFTFHLCEVEEVVDLKDDFIFDVKILPDRAHDLLSHRGIAIELASLLSLDFVDPVLSFKKIETFGHRPIGETKDINLEIEIKSQKCRRYMGRIIRGIKVEPSPEWMVKFLENIGQRSINNIVDAANIVMFDCGQPTHAFDLEKVKDQKIIIRDAENEEKILTLDNRDWVLKNSDLVIADNTKVLAVAGVKGGKFAEVNNNTKDIILEVANFDPVSIRKTAQSLNIFTDARKRFENDLSPELGDLAMQEFSALIAELCPNALFEDIVDVYPQKQEIKKLSFRMEKISSILGIKVSVDEIKNILERYNFSYSEKDGVFEIIVPYMRMDLVIEEDIAEEIGRIMGYDKVLPQQPLIDFKPSENEIFSKIILARNKLLNDGYSEVMTYVFKDKGEVEVLASASDKKFLRNNLSDGLKESLRLNQLNSPLLETNDVKIFEIGTVFSKNGEEIHVAFGDKKEIKEMTLGEFCLTSPDTFVQVLGSPVQNSFEEQAQPDHSQKYTASVFKSWSIYPFVVRDIAVWVPENISSSEVQNTIKENAGNMLVSGPNLFDEFKKDGRISYAFKLVFQSHERTLTDIEINEIMTKITNKIKDKNDWQVR